MGLNAGSMRYKVAFERRELDDNAERRGAWSRQINPIAAAITWLRGSEAVMQQRLEAMQPVVITVRRTPRTLAIGADWRAVDAAGVTYNITGISPAKADPLGGLDILATTGGANG